jgi:Cu/Ag efflux pump CusA
MLAGLKTAQRNSVHSRVLTGCPRLRSTSGDSRGEYRRSYQWPETALPRVISQLPEDVKVEVIRDQSRYIEAALHEIQTHLVLGSILASLVVLIFMRSWRSTLIAAVAIPVR